MLHLGQVCTRGCNSQFGEYIRLAGVLHVSLHGPDAEVPVVPRPGAEVLALLVHLGRGRVVGLGSMHLVPAGEGLAPIGEGL